VHSIELKKKCGNRRRKKDLRKKNSMCNQTKTAATGVCLIKKKSNYQIKHGNVVMNESHSAAKLKFNVHTIWSTNQRCVITPSYHMTRNATIVIFSNLIFLISNIRNTFKNSFFIKFVPRFSDLHVGQSVLHNFVIINQERGKVSMRARLNKAMATGIN